MGSFFLFSPHDYYNMVRFFSYVKFRKKGFVRYNFSPDTMACNCGFIAHGGKKAE